MSISRGRNHVHKCPLCHGGKELHDCDMDEKLPLKDDPTSELIYRACLRLIILRRWTHSKTPYLLWRVLLVEKLDAAVPRPRFTDISSVSNTRTTPTLSCRRANCSQRAHCQSVWRTADHVVLSLIMRYYNMSPSYALLPRLPPWGESPVVPQVRTTSKLWDPGTEWIYGSSGCHEASKHGYFTH